MDNLYKNNDINEMEYIDLYSCCYRKIDNMTFRAHPNYKKKGTWYDCVSTKWDYRDTEVEIPDRCIIFLKIKDNIKVLCQTCNHQSPQEKQNSNKMFSHWSMSVDIHPQTYLTTPKYYLVDVACINKQEWLVMEHPSLFYQKEKNKVNPKIIWIHNICSNWVEHFLQA